MEPILEENHGVGLEKRLGIRVLTDLTENPSSVPRTYMTVYYHLSLQLYRTQLPLLVSADTCTHVHEPTYTHN